GRLEVHDHVLRRRRLAERRRRRRGHRLEDDEPDQEVMLANESARGAANRRGFTLTELLIVIALIGLLFGLVFMKLDSLVPSQRLKADARELASSLDQARNYAIVSGKPVIFAYDIDNRAYRYYVPFELSDDGNSIVGPGEFELHDWIFLRQDVEFKDI